MKDPFQSALNAYEILEVPHNATSVDIQAAFRRALTGKYRGQAQLAWGILNNENNRAREDFFMYDGDYIETMLPKEQFVDNLKNNRFGVASDYKKIQTGKFPEVGPITHLLAILWFWTAENEERKCWEKISANSSLAISDEIASLELCWSKAIAYLVAILDSPEYLERWIEKRVYFDPSKKQEMIRSISEKVRSSLENNLQNYHDKYNTSNKSIALVYGKLLDSYRLETSCAGKIRSLQLQLNSHVLPGIGKIFIEEHGFTNELKRMLSASGFSAEKQQHVNELLIIFSKYTELLDKIQRKQFKSALTEIDGLTDAEKAEPEVVQLTAAALKGALKYAISNKKTEDLKEYIKKFFKKPTSSFKTIVITLADDIDGLARDIKDANPEDAIEILKWANKMVPDHENIKLRLADLLFIRGIDSYNKAFEKYQQDPSDKNRKGMMDGFKDVKDSLDLKYTDHVQKQYDIINNYLQRINQGWLPENKKPEKKPPEKPKNSNGVEINNQGVALLDSCKTEYETYIKTKALIDELYKIQKSSGLNQKGKDMLADSLKVINSLNNKLYYKFREALDKFNAALKEDPRNETFRKNKESTSEFLLQLKKPRSSSSIQRFKPVVRIILYIALALLAYFIFRELQVNKSIF